MANTYQKETGVQVDMTRMSAGEIFARIRAEKDNPHGDIWWGGIGDPHLQAADEGLTDSYQSPMLPKLRDWAQRQAQRLQFRTVGIYLGALGFGYNTEDMKRRKLAPPACWADLIKPEFKGDVQMADPNSSGTASVPPEAPDLSKIKLIEYDFATYGSSATRTRLLGRWTNEVKNAPE
jgi:iron(III) transport system substrate-binding protein